MEFIKSVLENPLSLSETDDIHDFVIDIAMRSDSRSYDVSIKLLEMVLKSRPNHYRALCELESILSNTDYTEKHIEILKNIIKIGKQNGENVRFYEDNLNKWQRPAKDLAHATSIAYFENFHKLKKIFKNASIFCYASIGEIEILSDTSTQDVDNLNNLYIKIDEYYVEIRFIQGKKLSTEILIDSKILNNISAIITDDQDGWDSIQKFENGEIVDITEDEFNEIVLNVDKFYLESDCSRITTFKDGPFTLRKMMDNILKHGGGNHHYCFFEGLKKTKNIDGYPCFKVYWGS